MSDLPARLEDEAKWYATTYESRLTSTPALMREAAAEIERLQRELDELRGALREHAIRSLFRPHDGPDNEVSGNLCMRCDCWWKQGEPEYHAAGCLAKGAA